MCLAAPSPLSNPGRYRPCVEKRAPDAYIHPAGFNNVAELSSSKHIKKLTPLFLMCITGKIKEMLKAKPTQMTEQQ